MDVAKIGRLATELPIVVGIMSLPSVSEPRARDLYASFRSCFFAERRLWNLGRGSVLSLIMSARLVFSRIRAAPARRELNDRLILGSRCGERLQSQHSLACSNLSSIEQSRHGELL